MPIIFENTKHFVPGSMLGQGERRPGYESLKEEITKRFQCLKGERKQKPEITLLKDPWYKEKESTVSALQ